MPSLDDFLAQTVDLSSPRALSDFLLACADLGGEAHFVCTSIPDVALDYAESVSRKLNAVRAILVLVDTSLLPEGQRQALISDLESTIAYIERFIEDPDFGTRSSRARTERRGGRGRPRLIIDVHRAVQLFDVGVHWVDIAALMGTNRETLRQRVLELPPHERQTRHMSVMSDDEVDAWITHLHENHPFVGATIMQGHLRNNGIFLPRPRIQESLRRVDEDGVRERWGRYIRRRVYHVSGANALWHMDGNEKLKPWGFIIHGCIDGYSRRVIYCKVSNNKRASTVASFFRSATAEVGWPSRVRGDFGTENNEVERLMHERWSEHHLTPYLRGKSQQNVRIERFWRDLRKDTLETYRIIFLHLEQCNWFDIERVSHRTCLYLTFAPRIQRNLDASTNAWNNHALRTENDRTPMILFETSRYTQEAEGIWPGQYDDADEWYGVDGNERIRPARDNGGEPAAPRQEPPEASMYREGIYVCSDAELEWVRTELSDHDFDRDDGNWGVSVFREGVERLQALHPDVDAPSD